MSNRIGPILLTGAALVALVCGLYAYFAPMTGVTGVWGPLAASFGALCLAIGGVLAIAAQPGAARIALLVLLAVGLCLTAFATALLHQWGMLAALAVCALGLLLTLARPKGAAA